jgi:hypothetical protein
VAIYLQTASAGCIGTDDGDLDTSLHLKKAPRRGLWVKDGYAGHSTLTTLLPLRKSAEAGHGTKSAHTNDYCCDSSGTVTAS